MIAKQMVAAMYHVYTATERVSEAVERMKEQRRIRTDIERQLRALPGAVAVERTHDVAPTLAVSASRYASATITSNLCTSPSWVV